MQKIANYKKCSLDARAHERTDGQGYMAEVYVRQPDGDSDVVTQFERDVPERGGRYQGRIASRSSQGRCRI